MRDARRWGTLAAMSDREAALAAALRANLRRRKAAAPRDPPRNEEPRASEPPASPAPEPPG